MLEPRQRRCWPLHRSQIFESNQQNCYNLLTFYLKVNLISNQICRSSRFKISDGARVDIWYWRWDILVVRIVCLKSTLVWVAVVITTGLLGLLFSASPPRPILKCKIIKILHSFYLPGLYCLYLKGSSLQFFWLSSIIVVQSIE